MGDKEININGKKYSEETKVTLSIKTLMWIVGLLFTGIVTLASIGYFDIINNAKEQRRLYEEERENIENVMEKNMRNILEEDRDARIEIVKTIGEMKGDIKVILDRTSRNNDHNSSGNIKPINTGLNVPESNTLPTPESRD